MTVSPLDKQDKLSFLIDFFFASKLKKKGDPPMEDLDETFFYSESWVESIVSWIGIVLAAGLLIGAIVGLDQLESKNARMGTICALTVSFALVLFITTTSTRGEIFGASAAYVLFVVHRRHVLTKYQIRGCSRSVRRRRSRQIVRQYLSDDEESYDRLRCARMRRVTRRRSAGSSKLA